MDDSFDTEVFDSIFDDDTSEGLDASSYDLLDFSETENEDEDLSTGDKYKDLVSLIWVSSELRLIIDRVAPVLQKELAYEDYISDYNESCAGMSGGTREQYRALMNLTFDLEFVPTEGDLPPGIDGQMDARLGVVTIKSGLTLSQKIRTLSHELGHVILHSDPKQIWDKYPEQIEVEAESVALLLCDHLGVDTNFSSELYIAGWMQAGEYVPASLFVAIEDDVVNTYNVIKDNMFSANKHLIDYDPTDNYEPT